MDSFEAEVTIMKRKVLLICALFTILAGCMASPIPNTERDQHMDSKKETAKTFLLIGVTFFTWGNNHYIIAAAFGKSFRNALSILPDAPVISAASFLFPFLLCLSV